MHVPYSAPLARHVRSSENFGRFNRTSKSAWLRDPFMYFVRSGVTRASIGSPQPSQTPFIMSYNGKIQTANHATKPLGILPRFHHVAFSDPPEQQCYLTTINTMPPGWCIPVFPFRSGANERNRKWEPTQHFQPRSRRSWRTMPSSTIFSLPPFRHTPAAKRRRKK